jgi:hypothetical protein
MIVRLSGLFLAACTAVTAFAQQPPVAPVGPPISPPICVDCGRSPPTFVIRSYQGHIRCLDYTPEKTGSPVFINDCSVAHPVIVEDIGDGKHTVVLHAGTKVIGIPRTEVNADRSATPQLDAAAQPPSDEQYPLELLTPGIAVTSGNYWFALDGDSIILASNRNLVTQVQNARGAIGSPVIVATRTLTDREFWDFVATDGTDRDPTNGFIRVGYPGDPIDPRTKLLSLLPQLNGPPPSQPAGPGTVIKIAPGTEIDLTGLNAIEVPAQVTIRGDRRGTSFGPQLSIGPRTDAIIFGVIGDDVRITGLRLQGPNTARKTESGQQLSWAIRVPQPISDGTLPQFARVIVDHNDISDWVAAGVEVDGPNDDQGSCSIEKFGLQNRTPNAHITHNFIHHNLQQDLGYGVVVSKDGYAQIDSQTFVSNRHAIASDGHPGSSYRAWYNLVLSYGPLQHTLDIPYHTQDFDMHGVGDNGFGGTAGDYVDVFDNTFFGTDRPNFEMRGYPCQWDEFHGNISLESLDDAIKWKIVVFRLGDSGSIDFNNPYIRVATSPNQFNHSNPTTKLGVGDFDGDGADDLFLATGAGWYYSPSGKAEWRLLSAKTDTLDQLLFGDFDGDGRTDVVTIQNGRLMVSWGGASSWEVLNSNPAPGAITDMATGDFLGDKRSDIFFANGSQWLVSDGGSAQFVQTQTSSYRVKDLRFGDFDGDGKTDVFGVEGGNWSYSRSATDSWKALRPALSSNVNGLVVADFNGDGVADVAANCDHPTCWRISYRGFEDWREFSQPYGLVGPEFAGVGHFLGHIEADVLSWNVSNQFWMCDMHVGQETQLCLSVGAITSAQRYSTQDMR